jgi:hypothetical protein
MSLHLADPHYQLMWYYVLHLCVCRRRRRRSSSRSSSKQQQQQQAAAAASSSSPFPKAETFFFESMTEFFSSPHLGPRCPGGVFYCAATGITIMASSRFRCTFVDGRIYCLPHPTSIPSISTEIQKQI